MLPFVVALVMLLASAVLLYSGGEIVPCRRAATCEPAANVLGFFAGSLVGVISLGAFVALDNRRKASTSRRYRSWRISPRGLIIWIVSAAWILGMLHMFGFALHLTRLL
ncbi:MAG: hypothetical protein OXE79_07755 [Acidimicrobiaceae bacterium]|nr:hypothetical protein [Acidimicrobiaceae bacterium]MCY4174743.1 hypothetical protein [Acidimicrobiaceae bacterium]MCY4279509.1 hypothetical protein [Acidimicrobiaceae bacterium]MCY4293474.1 hypothetical protein [Acidimicrobiaceae bacterium]